MYRDGNFIVHISCK